MLVSTAELFLGWTHPCACTRVCRFDRTDGSRQGQRMRRDRLSPCAGKWLACQALRVRTVDGGGGEEDDWRLRKDSCFEGAGLTLQALAPWLYLRRNRPRRKTFTADKATWG